MIKFVSSDLPVLLNVDVGTYVLMFSAYLFLLFVGIAVACKLDVRDAAFVKRGVFFWFFEKNRPLATRHADFNFALGP